jgi:hypothetical protein
MENRGQGMGTENWDAGERDMGMKSDVRSWMAEVRSAVVGFGVREDAAHG